MKRNTSILFVVVVLAAGIVLSGCERPPVKQDETESAVKPNYSPAHKALVEQRQAEMDGK